MVAFDSYLNPYLPFLFSIFHLPLLVVAPLVGHCRFPPEGNDKWKIENEK